MKKIEVSDEMYDKLVVLATEMLSQDPRCTSMPHLFQIKTKEQVAAYDGCGEEVWVSEEGEGLSNDKEIKEWICEDLFDRDESLMEDGDVKKICEKKVEEMDEDDLEGYLDGHRDNWRKVSVTMEDKYQNAFFTAKACQEHIDKNNYHYKEPTVYLNHSWRNPEMDLVSEFLCGIIGKKQHK